MATNQSSSGTTQSRTNTTSSQTRKAEQNPAGYARQAAETAVDVPVGAALTVADRVNETVKPFRKRT